MRQKDGVQQPRWGPPTSLPACFQQASYQEARPGGQPTLPPGELAGAPLPSPDDAVASGAGAALLGL